MELLYVLPFFLYFFSFSFLFSGASEPPIFVFRSCHSWNSCMFFRSFCIFFPFLFFSQVLRNLLYLFLEAVIHGTLVCSSVLIVFFFLFFSFLRCFGTSYQMRSSFLQGGQSYQFEQVPNSPLTNTSSFINPFIMYLFIHSFIMFHILPYPTIFSIHAILTAFQPTKDTIKSYEPSIRDSVAYHIVDGITRHTSTFFGKMFQNIGNFNKSRKNGHVDDNVEVGVGAGTGTGVGADNNVISSPRQKPKEDLYQEGELVIMVTDLGAGTRPLHTNAPTQYTRTLSKLRHPLNAIASSPYQHTDSKHTSANIQSLTTS